jgi:hypothetical protein
MIQELAEVLRQKIELAALVEKPGGLATVWEYGKGDKLTKCAVWNYQTQEHEFIAPDADIASLTYFEEINTAITNAPIGNYSTDLRLIGWCNTLKGVNTPVLIQSLQEVFKRPFNSGVFTGIKVQFTALLPESKELFAKYGYDNSVKKYLQKPYDAFGLRLTVTYNINTQC